MLLLTGLGNPGAEYAKHRHNVGFMAIDAIAAKHGFSPFRKKFQSELADGVLSVDGKSVKTLLLKPQTYMNDSGRAVSAAMSFYKIPLADVFVFHDELDLAPGKLRVKIGGGAAGHNGLRSITAHSGADFHRVRIGIGHPGDKARVTGHVLGDFSKGDNDWLAPMLDALAEAAPQLTNGGVGYGQAVGEILKPQPPKKAAKPRQNAPSTDQQSEAESRGDTAAAKSASGKSQLAEALKQLLPKK